MTDQLVVDLARQAMLLALMLAGPLLATALVVGLGISVLQSLTQIQEQSISFLPKMLAVSGVLLLLLPWMLQMLVKYTTELITGLPNLVR